MPESVQVCNEFPLVLLQISVILTELFVVVECTVVLRTEVVRLCLQLFLLLLPSVLQALETERRGGEGRRGEGGEGQGEREGEEGRGGERGEQRGEEGSRGCIAHWLTLL